MPLNLTAYTMPNIHTSGQIVRVTYDIRNQNGGLHRRFIDVEHDETLGEMLQLFCIQSEMLCALQSKLSTVNTRLQNMETKLAKPRSKLN